MVHGSSTLSRANLIFSANTEERKGIYEDTKQFNSTDIQSTGHHRISHKLVTYVLQCLTKTGMEQKMLIL